MTPLTLQEIVQRRAQRIACAVVTNSSSYAQTLVNLNDAQSLSSTNPPHHAAQLASKDELSGAVRIDNQEWFVTLHLPPPRIIVAGAVHIARRLVALAHECGFDTVVIDPRAAFTDSFSSQHAQIHVGWPDQILPKLKPDARTAFVTLTHDPKIDDPALMEALNSPCRHIAALGSKKTQLARKQRLLKAGADENSLNRIRGPAGLPIGAVTPAEIAVAVLAEIIQSFRAPS